MKLCAVTLLCSVLAFVCGAEECSTDQLQDLPAVCRNESAFEISEFPTNEEVYRASELACVTCGEPLYDYLACSDPPEAKEIDAICAKNENGDVCYKALFPLDGTTTDLISVSASCGATLVSGSDCSMTCKNTLESWSKAAGCCITSFYELLNITFIQDAVSESFWKKCGVDRPGTCTGAFSSSKDSSVAMEASFVAMAAAALLSQIKLF